jgi:hypothetical protein
MAIAHHGVQRAAGLVGQSQRRSPQKGVEQRGRCPVRGILCHGLDHRPQDLWLRQVLRIPAYVAAKALAGLGQIPLFQGIQHFQGGKAQAAPP